MAGSYANWADGKHSTGGAIERVLELIPSFSIHKRTLLICRILDRAAFELDQLLSDYLLCRDQLNFEEIHVFLEKFCAGVQVIYCSLHFFKTFSSYTSEAHSSPDLLSSSPCLLSTSNW